MKSTLEDLPKPEPVVLDYSKIKFPTSGEPVQVQPVSIKAEIKESTEELQA